MFKNENNFAYIDGANLYGGIVGFGWKLDYKRFRVWLSEKYGVKNAYIFIGLIPRYRDLYKYLQECGFTLIFKEVVYDGNGKAKGNCDADLVLQATSDFYEKKCSKAILVSSDGDYACLVSFLIKRNAFGGLLSPGKSEKCSILLKRTGTPIVFMDNKKSTLAVENEKTPDADGTA